jgi:hypothetical protein
MFGGHVLSFCLEDVSIILKKLKSVVITMEFNQNQIENLETTADFLKRKFYDFQYKDGKIKKRRKEVLFLI